MAKYKIGVLYGKSLIYEGDEPFTLEKLNNSYTYFSKLAKEMDIELYIAHYSEFENKKLKRAWILDGDWKIVEDIPIDIIYDKFEIASAESMAIKKKIASEIIMINNPELEELCKDKWLTHETFNEFMYPMFLVKNKEEIADAVKEIKTSKAVLKPRWGFGSIGLVIDDKEKLVRNISNDHVIEEFIDGSKGIPELGIKGVHDIRVIIVNGKTVDCWVRQPSEGFVSNLSRGGNYDKN